MYIYVCVCAENVKDECVSCGEEAHIYYVECNGSRCNTCNEHWHKHPKRRHHSTEVYVVCFYMYFIYMYILAFHITVVTYVGGSSKI